MQWTRPRLIFGLLALLIPVLLQPRPALATGFIVDSTADAVDAIPGDGICATASMPDEGVRCTLRAAVMEANASGGAPTITLPSGTFRLTNGVIQISVNLQIVGNGVSQTIVDGHQTSGVFSMNNSPTVGIASLTIKNGNSGGIINTGGQLTVTNIGISNNSPYGIFNDSGNLNVTNSVINNNSGSGITNVNGPLNVTSSAIIGNSSTGNGGGINSGSSGKIIVTNSIISSNSSNQSGGIYNGDQLTVTNSTIEGNSAQQGGGIYSYPGPLTVTNSTLSGNRASEGGGIYPVFGSLTVTHSTLSGNRSSIGGGIYNFGSSVSIRATVFDTGVLGSNCFGSVTSLGSNVADDDSCFAGGANRDKVVTDLMLGPLADNGGPTKTHALLPGSPAIDSIQGFCTNDGTAGGTSLTTDQRGFIRPLDGDANGTALCDAGAFEAAVPLPTATPTLTPPATLTPTPTATLTLTPAATPTATATQVVTACDPRPRVDVQTTQTGPGLLHVVVTATTNAGQPANVLRSIQIAHLDNAVVDIPVQLGVGAAYPRIDSPQSVTVELAPSSVEMTVRRVNPGAFTAHLAVFDSCGPVWSTFVGGGIDVQ